YYGKVAPYLDEKPRCPVMYHYGSEDQSIPLADVERIRAAARADAVYVYAGAGHGFSCKQRASFEPQAAALARTRTLDFFARYVGGAATGARASPGASTS